MLIVNVLSLCIISTFVGISFTKTLVAKYSILGGWKDGNASATPQRRTLDVLEFCTAIALVLWIGLPETKLPPFFLQTLALFCLPVCVWLWRFLAQNVQNTGELARHVGFFALCFFGLLLLVW